LDLLCGHGAVEVQELFWLASRSFCISSVEVAF